MAEMETILNLLEEMHLAAKNEDDDYANEIVADAFKFAIEFLPSYVREDARQLLHLYLTNEEAEPQTIAERMQTYPIPTTNDVKEEIFQAIRTGFALSVFGYATDEPQDATIHNENDEPDEPAWVMSVATSDKHLYEVWLRDRGLHPELQVKGEEENNG